MISSIILDVGGHTIKGYKNLILFKYFYMNEYLIPPRKKKMNQTSTIKKIQQAYRPTERSAVFGKPQQHFVCSEERCWKDITGVSVLHHYTCDGTSAQFSVPNVPTSNPTGVEAVSWQLATQFMWCMGDLARLCQTRNQLHLLLISTSPSWAPELKEIRERQRNSSQILFAIAHGMKLVKVFKGHTLEWNRFRDNQGNTYQEWVAKQWDKVAIPATASSQDASRQAQDASRQVQAASQAQAASQVQAAGNATLTTDTYEGTCARCGDEAHGDRKCDWGYDGQAANCSDSRRETHTTEGTGYEKDGLIDRLTIKPDEEEQIFISSSGMRGEDALLGSAEEWGKWNEEFTVYWNTGSSGGGWAPQPTSQCPPREQAP